MVDAQQYLADAETELATVRADLASAEQAAATEDAEDAGEGSAPTLEQDQACLVAMLQRRFLSQHDQTMIPHLKRIMGVDPHGFFPTAENATPELGDPRSPGNRFSTPLRHSGYGGSLASPSYGALGATLDTRPHRSSPW